MELVSSQALHLSGQRSSHPYDDGRMQLKLEARFSTHSVDLGVRGNQCGEFDFHKIHSRTA